MTRIETAPEEVRSPNPDNSLRALHVLETLASMEQPASLDAIASRSQLTKSKAYRSLRALQQRGFVDHGGRRGYRLGSRSVALASLIGPRPALLQRARPVLTQLAELASGGATLHMRSGAYRVLVLKVVSPAAASYLALVPVPVGERAPLTSGCSGTTILAHLGSREADAIIASRPEGEPRPTAAFMARIRADGYAISFSNNHPGMNGIAAPLLDPVDGAPLGSVAIGVAAERSPEDVLRRLSGPLILACRRLAPRLAQILGPNSSERRAALDVTIQDFLETQE